MNRVNRGWTVFCISSCLRVCHSQLKLSKRPKEADEKDRDKTAEAVLRGRVSVQKRRSRLCTILPKGRKRAWGVKGESSKLYHLQMQTRHGRSKKSWHLGLLNFFVFIWKKNEVTDWEYKITAEVCDIWYLRALFLPKKSSFSSTLQLHRGTKTKKKCLIFPIFTSYVNSKTRK